MPRSAQPRGTLASVLMVLIALSLSGCDVLDGSDGGSDGPALASGERFWPWSHEEGRDAVRQVRAQLRFDELPPGCRVVTPSTAEQTPGFADPDVTCVALGLEDGSTEYLVAQEVAVEEGVTQEEKKCGGGGFFIREACGAVLTATTIVIISLVAVTVASLAKTQAQYSHVEYTLEVDSGSGRERGDWTASFRSFAQLFLRAQPNQMLAWAILGGDHRDGDSDTIYAYPAGEEGIPDRYESRGASAKTGGKYDPADALPEKPRRGKYVEGTCLCSGPAQCVSPKKMYFETHAHAACAAAVKAACARCAEGCRTTARGCKYY